MTKLPIGIQTFKNLIEEGYLYVDKTPLIHRLITGSGKYFLLCRPKRFGKSLLLSTIKEIFSGNAELFKGLWIENHLKWEKHPVIHIDFELIYHKSGEQMRHGLLLHLHKIARQFNLEIKASSIKEMMGELVAELGKLNKVVILIDEYDHPLQSGIFQGISPDEHLKVLQEFYGALKGLDPYIRFMLATGVSKFSDTTTMLGLNQFRDITINADYNGLVGFTRKELMDHFGGEITRFAERFNTEEETVKEEIDRWYKGYSWYNGNEQLYNPYTILNFFTDYDFKGYWFTSERNQLITRLINQDRFEVNDLENRVVGELTFDYYDFSKISLVSFLFLNGYLTIIEKRDKRGRKQFLLDYPNLEVKDSFLQFLLAHYLQQEISSVAPILWKLEDALEVEDMEMYFSMIQALFGAIAQKRTTKATASVYRSIIYMLLRLMDIEMPTHVEVFPDRIDSVIETENTVYIMGFKTGSAHKAIQQLVRKGYSERYEVQNRKIITVGIGFDLEKQNITEWLIQ